MLCEQLLQQKQKLFSFVYIESVTITVNLMTMVSREAMIEQTKKKKKIRKFVAKCAIAKVCVIHRIELINKVGVPDLCQSN